MRIEQIFTNSPLRNYTYLIAGEDGSVYCLDPWDGEQVVEVLGESRLSAIINTHEHADHTRGNEYLVKHYNCQVWAHSQAKSKIVGVDRGLEAGEKISLGGDCYLEVMDTPGHTFAHLCLLLVEGQKPRAVFTGDTLFNAGVGNCKNGGDPTTLYKTISQKFQNLDDRILLYPGHEYWGSNLEFTLSVEPDNKRAKELLQSWQEVDFTKEEMISDMATEREVNTFLRLDSRQVMENIGVADGGSQDVFLGLRKLRDDW